MKEIQLVAMTKTEISNFEENLESLGGFIFQVDGEDVLRYMASTEFNSGGGAHCQ